MHATMRGKGLGRGFDFGGLQRAMRKYFAAVRPIESWSEVLVRTPWTAPWSFSRGLADSATSWRRHEAPTTITSTAMEAPLPPRVRRQDGHAVLPSAVGGHHVPWADRFGVTPDTGGGYAPVNEPAPTLLSTRNQMYDLDHGNLPVPMRRVDHTHHT